MKPQMMNRAEKKPAKLTKAEKVYDAMQKVNRRNLIAQQHSKIKAANA